MKYEKIALSQTNPKVFLEVFAGDPIGGKIRDAILVIPGGGYSGVCSDREGEPIALAFLSLGIQAFVLHYTVGEAARFPQPLVEASQAVAWIRRNAAAYSVNPDRIFATGFSAGGHLCASLGTMYNDPGVLEKAGISSGENKIAGMIPVYPVINSHSGTLYFVYGTHTPTEEQKKRWDIISRVGPDTVPAYIIHTCSDQTVPVSNSLDLANALSSYRIPYELHVYRDGVHGIALANEITDLNNPVFLVPAASHWVVEAASWMKTTK